MVFITLIIVLAVVSVADYYIWSNFIKGGKRIWSILHWLPAAGLLAMVFLSRTNLMWSSEIFRLLIFLLLTVTMAKYAFALFSLIGKCLSAALRSAPAVCNYLGLGAALAVILCMGYGMTIGWKKIAVKQIDLSSENIPQAFEGYTIVQLSDIHIGTFSKAPETVKNMVAKVNALQPDAIFFTGDLVNVSPDELKPFIPELSAMSAPDGVYAILGNHDYCEYLPGIVIPEEGLAELVQLEENLGWTILRNEHRMISRGDDRIAVIGVENDGEPPFPARGDLVKASKGLPADCYKILLSHNPTHWKREVLPESDIQLTLSGHTHAMQLKVGNFSPAKWRYPEWGGLYEEGSRKLYVNTGLGGTVKFRLGVPGEITVIRLHSK